MHHKYGSDSILVLSSAKTMLSQCWVTDESLLSHSGKYFVASNLNITFCCINFSHLILVLSNAAEQCWDANTFINFPLRDHSSEKDFQAWFIIQCYKIYRQYSTQKQFFKELMTERVCIIFVLWIPFTSLQG